MLQEKIKQILLIDKGLTYNTSNFIKGNSWTILELTNFINKLRDSLMKRNYWGELNEQNQMSLQSFLDLLNQIIVELNTKKD